MVETAFRDDLPRVFELRLQGVRIAAMEVRFDAIAGDKTAVDPETLTVGLDADAEPVAFDQAELEALAFAYLLEGMTESDEDDTRGDVCLRPPTDIRC